MALLHDNMNGMAIRPILAFLALSVCGRAMPAADAPPVVRILQRSVVIDAPAPASTPVPAVPAGIGIGHGQDGANLKLWLYDPRSADGQGLATSIFIQDAAPGASWRQVAASADGSLYLRLPPGAYRLDTVEPSGGADRLRRHRYMVSVSPQGVASVAGLEPDNRGVFAVTLDLDRTVPAIDAGAQARRDRLKALAEEPASTFQPTSACQLPDHVAPVRSFASDTSTGFPKVRVRLPASGPIHALIVPGLPPVH